MKRRGVGLASCRAGDKDLPTASILFKGLTKRGSAVTMNSTQGSNSQKWKSGFQPYPQLQPGQNGTGREIRREAVKTDPENHLPAMHHLLGAILAHEGSFPSAAEEYRSFLKLAPSSPAADQLRKQLTEWKGLGVIQRSETPAKTARMTQK